MSKKAKSGGCKKKIRSPKTSKGERRNIAKPFGNGLSLINAHRYQ